MATTTITDTEFQTVIPLVPIPSHLPTLQDGKDHPQLESKDVTGSDHEVYPTRLKGGKAIMVALQLMLVMVCNSFTMGLVTIGVTKIADDLHMNQSLVYWPAIVYNLTSSPLLLPFGSIADIVGARPVNLMGSLLCGIFVLSCGLARTGNQLIAFRGLQGVGAALYLPTSMSIISTALAIGKLRNIALASLGLGQVIGYGLGLVIGGVLIDTIGWRTGFYICGALQLALFLLGSFTIPRAANPASNTAETAVWQKLRKQMDWTGALISCVSIGMLSYVLAMLAEDSTAIKKPWNITLLALSLLLVPVFVFWMRRQERHNKPAMIPNSLWTTAFTSICVMIAFSYAEIQCMEMLTSLLYAALS